MTEVGADLASFDETEAWMHESDSDAMTAVALFEGTPRTNDAAVSVSAVQTAG